MEDYQSARICITLPVKLLRQLDEIAKHTYNSRSNMIRLALMSWISSEPAWAGIASIAAEHQEKQEKTLSAILTLKQQTIFKNYQRGELAYNSLIEAGISPEMQLELMQLGEM